MNFGALRRLTRLDGGLFSATSSPSAGLDPVHPSRESCSPANCASIAAPFSATGRYYDPGTLAAVFKSQILAHRLIRRIGHSGAAPQLRVALRSRQNERDWATALRNGNLRFRFGH
jgi:hypothetical protein